MTDQPREPNPEFTGKCPACDQAVHGAQVVCARPTCPCTLPVGKTAAQTSTQATQPSLRDLLVEEQASRCSYGTREGDGRTCDCKYANPFAPPGHRVSAEVTGCPELRAAIWTLDAAAVSANTNPTQ